MHLLAKRKTAHIIMGMRLLATVYAVVRVFAVWWISRRRGQRGPSAAWCYFRSGSNLYRADGTALIVACRLSAFAAGGEQPVVDQEQHGEHTGEVQQAHRELAAVRPGEEAMQRGDPVEWERQHVDAPPVLLAEP